MKTTIFYFSATGNSLHFAKELALELKTKNIVSMAESMGQGSIETTAQKIGLVFPVYAWGPPRLVMDFIEKLNIKNNPYIFSIATCVGIPAKTLTIVRKKLQGKGAELHAGFAIKAKNSSLLGMNILDKIIIRLDKQKKRMQPGKERLTEITSVIKETKKHKPEESSWVANIFGQIFHEQGIKYFKTAAKAFEVNESCTGCGKCVRICPRANIFLKNGCPTFSNNCEFCHACIQWCPKFAITHPDFNPLLNQYKHPSIKYSDIIINI